MLTEEDRKIARQFKRRSAEVVPVLDLRVFASRASGNAEPDSDLDVFIELETCTPDLPLRISEIARELRFEINQGIATLVTTRAEVEHGATGANPLIFNLEREEVRP